MVARTFHFDVTQPVRTIKCGCGPTNYHFRTCYVRVALTRSPRWQAGRFGEGALWPPSHRLCLRRMLLVSLVRALRFRYSCHDTGPSSSGQPTLHHDERLTR